MVYYASFIRGYIEEILVEFEEGAGRDYWLFFRLRAKSIFIQLCKLPILT